MSWLLRAWRTVTSWTRRPPDGDLDRELRLHLELETEQNHAAGMGAEEAARRARVRLGNRPLIAEDMRAAWRWAWLDDLRLDLRLAGFELMAASVRFGEGARVLSGAAVTGNYFEVLGIQPWLGRLMASSDVTETDAREVVVLGHDLWQGRFDADPGVVGRGVQLNGRGDAPGGRSQPALGDDRTGHRYRGIVGLEPAREQLSVRRESDRAGRVRRRRAAARPCGGACQSRASAPLLPDRPDDGALGRVVRNPLRSRRIPAGLAGLGQSLASTTETPNDTAVPGPSRLRNQHA